MNRKYTGTACVCTAREIIDDLMVIDTRHEVFDMKQIDNRRFMFNPVTGIMVLGRQRVGRNQSFSSHAVELAEAGIISDYDNFIRGWVGTGSNYPDGIIHFAPCIVINGVLFDKAFDTIECFAQNGATKDTVIRAFGSIWEQPMDAILNAKNN